MNGWAFPNIFSGNSVKIIEGSDAVIKDLKLLFASETSEMRYDPGYGSNVNLVLMRPKNQLTLDLVVDAVCEAQMFVPNIIFNRTSVVTKFEKAGSVDITINALLDNNTYPIQLQLTQEVNS